MFIKTLSLIIVIIFTILVILWLLCIGRYIKKLWLIKHIIKISNWREDKEELMKEELDILYKIRDNYKKKKS